MGVERTLFMQEVESAKEAFRKQKSTRELRKKLLLLHVELHKIMTGEDGYSAFLDRDRTIIVFCGSLIPLLFHITTTLRRSCSSVDDEENKSIREARNEARRSLLQLVLHISETPSLRLHLLQNPWTVPSLQSLLIPSQDEDTFLDCEWYFFLSTFYKFHVTYTHTHTHRSLAVVHSLSMAVETEMHRYEGEDDNDIHIDVKKNWGPNYIITRLRPILVNLISLAANPGQFCDTNERLRLRRAVWSVFSRLCVSKSFGANATIEILSNGTLEKFVNDISDECKHAHVAGLLAITTFRAASEEKKVRSEVLSMCLDSVRTLCGLIEFEESAPEYRLEETEMLDIMQRVATLDSSPPLTKDTIVRMGDFVFHAMRYGHTEDSERRGKMIASVLRWMLQTKQGLENLKDRAPIFVRNLCLVLRRCLVENYISFDTIAIQTTCDALHIIALHDNKSLAHLVRADVITILSKVQSMVETSEDCGLDSMLRLITALVPLCDATCSTEQGRVFVCPRNDNTTSKFMDVTMELVVPDLLRMIGTHPRKSTFDLLARLACSDSSTDIILKLDNEISTFLIETFMTTNDLPTSFMTLLGELCRSRDVRRRVMKRDGMFQRLVTMYGNIATKICKDVIRDDQLYEFASSLALIFCRLAMDGRENDRSDPAILIGRSGLLVHFLRVGSRAASFYRSFVGNDKFDDTTPIFRAQLQSLCVLAVCFARSFLVPYALKMSSENLVKIFCDLSVILRGTGNSNEGVTRYRGPDRFLRCDLCRVVTALVVRSIILFPGSMGQWHHELHKANMLKTLQDVGRCYAISLRSEYGHYALDHLARDGATVLAKTSPSSSLKLEETEMIQPSRMIMTDPILSSPSPKRRDQQPLKRLRRRRLPEKIDTRLAHSVGRALEIMNVVDMKTGSPKKGRHGSRSSSCRRRRSPKKR